MTTPDSSSKAIFVSYASQDAGPTRRIVDALRAAGIEVWFDQSELRGGDAWDASIRRQIKTCKLFLAIISAHTQAREEGYFRREWNLAAARTLDMAHDATFLLPVVIDATSDRDARVPDKFRDVQWTRLPDGETPHGFAARVHALLGTKSMVESPVPAKAHPEVPRNVVATPEPAPRRARTFRSLRWVVPVLLLTAAGILIVPPWLRREHARTELLPALQDRVATMVRSNAQTVDLASAIEQQLPNDPALKMLWPMIATTLSIETDPPGAEVFWKDYDTPTAQWRSAGLTPLKDVKVARDFLRLEVRKPGYQTIELAEPSFSIGIHPIIAHLKLDPLGSLPTNMVRIPASKTEMYVVGLEKYGPRNVPEFLIDKYEVSNRQFKAFVEAGGYAKPQYWTHPFREGGKLIPIETAIRQFVDRTGRPGPATWEAGTFPDGTADHPVTGVSWYEAEAYAAFAHKHLPTVFHWAVVADTARSEFILPLSNFSNKVTIPVGSLAGLSTFGIYDIAGNAREWATNPSGDSDYHFILGGGWTDPSYAFNDSFSAPAMDRSESNGFRCIENLGDDAIVAALSQPLSIEFRDYSKERPVNDAIFASFSRQFIYDKNPLDAKIEKTVESDAWRAEVVSIDAGYNNERLRLYVFLPKNYSKPLQPVLFFSGSNGIHESQFDPSLINNRLAFIMKSGRALILPINKGTYERQDDLKSDIQDTTVRYKDHVIMWVKEYSRTVDYLETRKDMQADKLAYLGISWGGFMGGIVPAIEKRIKVIVLNVGGMAMEKALPEVDQINFLPRVTQPLLMLNGKYDMFFPVETAQKPMYALLGAAPDQKKMVVYDSGHVVPATEFIKETLAWYDKYLGPVQ